MTHDFYNIKVSNLELQTLIACLKIRMIDIEHATNKPCNSSLIALLTKLQTAKKHII